MLAKDWRNSFIIALLFCFRMLGLFMVLPVLAVDLANNQQISASLIGLAIGIYGFTQAIFQIPLGFLSDKWSRKPVIALGFVLLAIGSLIAAFAPSIGWLLVGRALQGCGAVAAVMLALLADITDIDKRARSMAIVGMSIGFSFLLALILGPMLYAWEGLSGIFLFTFGLSIIALPTVWKLLPAEPARSTFVNLNYSTSWRYAKTLLKEPLLWRFNISILLLHACLTILFLLVPNWLANHYNIPLTEHWQYYLLAMLLSLLLSLPLIIFSEKQGKLRFAMLVSIGLILSVFTLFLFFSPDTALLPLSMLIGLLCLFFGGFNVLEAILPSLVSRIAHHQLRGTAMGMFTMSQFLGAFIGATTAGLLLQTAGSEWLLGILIIIMLLWLSVPLKLPKKFEIMSRSFSLSHLSNPIDSQQLSNWALQQPGVIEAIALASDKTLILKVNKSKFQTEQFNQQLANF